MMAKTSLQFELPNYLTAEKFIKKLTAKADIRLASQNYSLKTYYDSFDWRLYAGKMVCELNQSKTESMLILKSFDSEQVIASMETDTIPHFAEGIDNKIRDLILPLLEMRALLPVTTLDFTLYRFNIVNKDEKTVLRLLIEAYDLIPSRVFLEPIKGYDKIAGTIRKELAHLDITEAREPVLVNALKTLGRRPKDYSSKLSIKLAPDLRADVAVKYIYSQLLKTIKANEQGTLADTDSEFLHDFRVAVRRTRSGLNQLKNVLPEAESARFTQYFAWLGQITTPTRDLDVYLLNFEPYKQSLPIALREDLNPLYDFLCLKKKQAQKIMVKKLKSPEHISQLIAWEDLLKSTAVKQPTQAQALLTIKELADIRIWKVFRRVVKNGKRITDQSPPEDLHDLRKTCKKLRYLMEFFQELYPDKLIKPLIKNLKDFQEILGDFQDLAVQEQTLKSYSEEMMGTETPARTLLAMGVLIQNLENRRNKARAAFSSRFEVFDREEIETTFKALFNA